MACYGDSFTFFFYFVKCLEAFLETVFRYLSQWSRRFCRDAHKLLFFLVAETREVTIPRNMTDAPKPLHCALIAIERCAGVLPCRRNRMFHACHENAYVTCKSPLSSLPSDRLLVQAPGMFLKEI
jgi:hypothetical protein